jgi:hypothetical protein
VSKNFVRQMPMVAAGLLSMFVGAHSAQARDAGWEAGIDLVYQDATTLDFDGGTKANLSTDYGLALDFGYRINANLEVQFAFDWANVDYSAAIVTGTGNVVKASGTYEALTPRVNVQYNFLTGAVTPFVKGGIGYSFVDTNIPTGRPQTGCWWDPWFGYLCTSVQNTKSIDGFAYQFGAGVRWDLAYSSSLRLSFERHWTDFGNGGTQDVDQIKLGYSWSY